MAGLVAGCFGGEDRVQPLYNHATGRILVQMPRPLGDDETLVTRARRGTLGKGQLDCATLAPTLAPLVDHDEDLRYYGPPVDQSLTVHFYGAEWAGEPTPEMLDAVAQGTDSIIDVCIVDSDGKVVEEIEEDLFKAWDVATDQGLNGKADDTDSDGEMPINSAQEYGVRCIGQLGEIPFFEKRGELDYGTYSCLDSTPIPMTVTNGGSVDRPDGVVSQCDKPQYIYSLCEQGPRVATKINEQGTRWVLLCRKSIGGLSSDQYNDIAMVGHNPFTGKACFFQNALYQRKDGGHVPHPADREKSANLWSGVHGGMGSGIECEKCHDADPFIHSPWIDGAKNPNGTSVVPRMGEDPDYAIGANDTPYKLINWKGQHWRLVKHVTDARASACTQCHRHGSTVGVWAREWDNRIVQQDAAWENIVTEHGRQFENARWMPPSGVDEAGWATSEFASAIAFLQTCSETSDCAVEDVPREAGGAEGNGKLRDTVTLSNAVLAEHAYTKLSSSGCKSCHTNPSSPTKMMHWSQLTKDAEGSGGCLDKISGGVEKNATEDKTVPKDDFQVFGPYEVAIGGAFKAVLTGSGDVDLYVKKHEKVTESAYDCRPFSSTSRETCGKDQFAAYGPGKFWVALRGKANSSRVTLKVTYDARGANQKKPMDVISCLKKDPGEEHSPFAPQKLGMYTVGAHLGWFADLFRGAYPAGDNGNTRDTWVIEYSKFKALMVMPKGNHPRLLQKDYSEVVEWFARGLPNLGDYVQNEPTPTVCTPGVSAEMSAHISQMATAGWRAVNKSRNLNMYGCSGGNDPRACMSSFPRANSKSYGSQWETGTAGLLKIAREFSGSTSYWMRTSANGRFIGNGGLTDAGAAITDLQRGVEIPADASYDPGFFPDNSGFIIQGSGANFCTTNLLTSNPAQITFQEPQCSNASNVSLYQHLSSSVDGGDHFVINGQFESDPGGNGSEPSAAFSSEAKIKITPLTFDGQKYTQKASVEFASAFEGDSVLSPSGTLIASRQAGPNGVQLGYVVRRLDAFPSGNTYTYDTPEVATYCSNGSKVAISFDERWMILHRYANDRSDIYLVDLANGQERKVTNMKAGQYALFPHWRSDNWFLFLVKDESSSKEYAVVGDAALALE